MKVAGIVCKKCHTFVFSRADHDLRRCPCQTVATDGGFSYLRVCFERAENAYFAEVEIPVTKQDLYLDWSRRTDLYGWLPEMQVTKTGDIS